MIKSLHRLNHFAITLLSHISACDLFVFNYDIFVGAN